MEQADAQALNIVITILTVSIVAGTIGVIRLLYREYILPL